MSGCSSGRIWRGCRSIHGAEWVDRRLLFAFDAWAPMENLSDICLVDLGLLAHSVDLSDSSSDQLRSGWSTSLRSCPDMYSGTYYWKRTIGYPPFLCLYSSARCARFQTRYPSSTHSIYSYIDSNLSSLAIVLHIPIFHNIWDEHSYVIYRNLLYQYSAPSWLDSSSFLAHIVSRESDLLARPLSQNFPTCFIFLNLFGLISAFQTFWMFFVLFNPLFCNYCTVQNEILLHVLPSETKYYFSLVISWWTSVAFSRGSGARFSSLLEMIPVRMAIVCQLMCSHICILDAAGSTQLGSVAISFSCFYYCVHLAEPAATWSIPLLQNYRWTTDCRSRCILNFHGRYCRYPSCSIIEWCPDLTIPYELYFASFYHAVRWNRLRRLDSWARRWLLQSNNWYQIIVDWVCACWMARSIVGSSAPLSSSTVDPIAGGCFSGLTCLSSFWIRDWLFRIYPLNTSGFWDSNGPETR